MPHPTRKRPPLSTAVSAASLLIAAASVTWAAGAPSAPGGAAGTIQACAKKKTGTLRLLTGGRRCAKGETAIAWSRQGPEGPAGKAGLAGKNGASGADGATGPQGPVGPLAGEAGGALTGSYPNPEIANRAVGTSALKDGAVTGIKLADGEVGSADLAAGAVTGEKIAAGTILAAKLAAGAISGGSGGTIADGTIVSADIGALTAVLGGVIGASAVLLNNKLAAGDTQPAFALYGSGKMEWGEGGVAAADVNLFRSAANKLKTDDQLVAADGITTRMTAGIPADDNFATPPADGTIVVDGTNNRLYARIGGTWKGVAIAVIP